MTMIPRARCRIAAATLGATLAASLSLAGACAPATASAAQERPTFTIIATSTGSAPSVGSARITLRDGETRCVVMKRTTKPGDGPKSGTVVKKARIHLPITRATVTSFRDEGCDSPYPHTTATAPLVKGKDTIIVSTDRVPQISI
ncbi:hypothetical protein QFZ62_001929 [Clavibacter sp. B3I6]|uniref:hypothetical protein n=1 Tax=Clavibacter sp. B3I6 TaxID=3042268 RepID=UPI002782C516|nr:hypothetical protein [Clavibacter sp. B3I6]MDQ0744621.1 hypothetical protein [Clavibacter sp. B3I6]